MKGPNFGVLIWALQICHKCICTFSYLQVIVFAKPANTNVQDFEFNHQTCKYMSELVFASFVFASNFWLEHIPTWFCLQIWNWQVQVQIKCFRCLQADTGFCIHIRNSQVHIWTCICKFCIHKQKLIVILSGVCKQIQVFAFTSKTLKSTSELVFASFVVAKNQLEQIPKCFCMHVQTMQTWTQQFYICLHPVFASGNIKKCTKRLLLRSLTHPPCPMIMATTGWHHVTNALL